MRIKNKNYQKLMKDTMEKLIELNALTMIDDEDYLSVINRNTSAIIDNMLMVAEEMRVIKNEGAK